MSDLLIQIGNQGHISKQEALQKLRQARNAVIPFASKNYNITEENKSDLLRAFDANIEAVSQDGFQLNNAGNYNSVNYQGLAGGNMDAIAHDLVTQVLNSIPLYKENDAPVVSYKYDKTSSVPSQPTDDSKKSDDSQKTDDKTEGDDKTTEEEKTEEKKIVNPYPIRKDEIIGDSYPVILLRQNGNKTLPELMNYIFNTSPVWNIDSRDEKFVSNKTDAANKIYFNNFYIHKPIPYLKSLGYDRTDNLQNKEQWKEYFGDGDTFSIDKFWENYLKALNQFRQMHFEDMVGANGAKKYLPFNDFAYMMMQRDGSQLADYQKYNFEFNGAMVNDPLHTYQYYVLPGQITKDKENYPSLFVVTRDPSSNKLTYAKKSIGAIVQDIIKDSEYNKENSNPHFLKNEVDSILSNLKNYKFMNLENWDSIPTHQMGGNVRYAKDQTVDEASLTNNNISGVTKKALEEKVPEYVAAARLRPVNKQKFSVQNYDAGFTKQDIARLAGAGLDLLSAGLNFSTAGTIAAPIAGIAGTLANAGADFTDDAVSAWDASKQLGINLATDVISLIPGAGGATKTAKAIRTITKYAGAVGMLCAAAGLPEEAMAFRKLSSGEDVTAEDLMKMARALTDIANIASGVGTYRRNALKDSEWAKSEDKIAVRVKNQDGQKQNLVFEGADAKAIKEAKNAEEYNKKIQEILGTSEFTVDVQKQWHRPEGSWLPKPNGETSPLRDVMVRDNGEMYIQGKPSKNPFKQETDSILDTNKVGTTKKVNGKEVLDSTGKPVKYTAEEAGNFNPKIKGFLSSKNAKAFSAASPKKVQKTSQIEDINENIKAVKKPEIQDKYTKAYKEWKNKTNADYDKNVADMVKDSKESDIIENIEKFREKRKAPKYSATGKTKEQLIKDLTKEVKMDSIKDLKESKAKLRDNFKNEAEKLLKTPVETSVFINGKQYKITHSLDTNKISADDILKELKIIKKQEGGNLDFKKLSKFVKKCQDLM